MANGAGVEEQRVVLPGVTAALLNDWLAQSRVRGQAAWLRSIQVWAQSQSDEA